MSAYTMSSWTLRCGSAREVLKTLPSASVQCCVTSPPYWGLRDYGVSGQAGIEPTPDAYVAALVAVFEEVRRVLCDDGSVWLNLGDSYAGSWGAQSREHAGEHGPNVSALSANQIKAARRSTRTGSLARTPGLKPKDLVGIPWRVAFALQAAGWWLRSDIIWAKPNCMPESVKDRPTRAHEYVFLLTKSARYAYYPEAIRKPFSQAMLDQLAQGYDGQAMKDYKAHGVQNPSDVKSHILQRARDKQRGHGRRHAGFNDRWEPMISEQRIKRKSELAAANIPGQSAHGYTRRDDGLSSMGLAGLGANARSVWMISTEASPYEHFAVMPKALARRCVLAGSTPGDMVLDPFAGMATTGVVALEEGRSFIGIELSETYHATARQRLSEVAPLLAREV
jgi:DNA modification methylase